MRTLWRRLALEISVQVVHGGSGRGTRIQAVIDLHVWNGVVGWMDGGVGVFCLLVSGVQCFCVDVMEKRTKREWVERAFCCCWWYSFVSRIREDSL